MNAVTSSNPCPVRQDSALPAGEGSTSFWGDIRVSSYGSATEQAVVRLHEKVHQFLAPKLYLLRNYRVSNRASSYVHSALWRYIEEALAETVAQVGVNGVRELLVGIRFPIQNGYAFLTKGGGYNPVFTGYGVLIESGALFYTGMVAGIAVEMRFVPSAANTTNKSVLPVAHQVIHVSAQVPRPTLS
jgi:hypothetical protein